MLISKALAQTTAATEGISPDQAAALANAPTAWEAFAWNMGLVFVLVMMFYILLIMPQQRRFKEHAAMLSKLKKGDKVITGGGLVGRIDKILNDEEIVIDLGNNLKVTALRSTINAKDDALLSKKPSNEDKKKNKTL